MKERHDPLRAEIDKREKAYEESLKETERKFAEQFKGQEGTTTHREARERLDKDIAKAREGFKEEHSELQESIAKETKQFEEKLGEDRKKQVSKLEEAYRIELYRTLDQTRESQLQSEIAQNQHIINQGESPTATVEQKAAASQARENIETLNDIMEKPTSFNELVKQAPKYVEDVHKANNARAALKSESIEAYVEALKPTIDKYYEDKMQKAKASLDPKELESLEAEKAQLLERLTSRSSALGEQFKFVEGQAQNYLEKSGHSLEADDKTKLREELIQFSAEYNGTPSRFATDFLNKHHPEMGPASVASLIAGQPVEGLEKGDTFDLSKVSKIVLRKDEMYIMQTGGAHVKITDREVLDDVMRKGIDLNGTKNQLFLQVDLDTNLAYDGKLALHGTTGKDIKMYAVGGGYNRDQRMEAPLINNIVSADPTDQKFNENQDARTWRAEIAAQKQELRKQLAMARAAGEVGDLKMQVAQAMRGLDPETQRQIAESGRPWNDSNNLPTPSTPGGPKGPDGPLVGG